MKNRTNKITEPVQQSKNRNRGFWGGLKRKILNYFGNSADRTIDDHQDDKNKPNMFI